MELERIQLTDKETLVLPPSPAPVDSTYRRLVKEIEILLLSHEDSLVNGDLPLEHSFADGVYIRTLYIPAGSCILGQLHRTSYYNSLLVGDISILAEDGPKRYKSPSSFVAPAMTKRLAIAHTDVVWLTVHPNPTNTADILELEKQIHIEEGYEEFRGKKIEVSPETIGVFNQFKEYALEVHDEIYKEKGVLCMI